MITIRPVVRVVACALVGLTAACTSSDDPDVPSSNAAAPSSTSNSATSSSASSAPSPSSAGDTSAPPTGLAAIEGSYLLAGSSADTAVLYRSSGGKLVRATGTAGITDVSAGGTTVAVGRETSDDETVELLRRGKLVGLRISGFGPAVSDTAELAWVTLGASTTPGISKPGGSVVRMRPSPTGTDRVVATFPASVSAPVWAGDDLIVAVADGNDGSSARIVRFTDGRGTGRTVARVADADALDITGRGTAITVATDAGAVVVTLRDGRSRPFATGWQPLCWTNDDTVLAARGGELGLVPVAPDGSPGSPKAVGRLPDGTRAFGGACGDGS